MGEADSRVGATDPPSEFGRRQFIARSTSTIAALTVLPQLELVEAVPSAVLAAVGRPRPTFRTTLRRREDFVNLEYGFYNLILRADGNTASLVRLDPTKEAWVVVGFPPQHLLEQAFDELSTALPSPGSVRAHLAQPSRLAFKVPPNVLSIPYDAAGLLEWGTWIQQVVPAAQPAVIGASNIALRQPRPWETAIELPWWLTLSPSAGADLWRSRTAPKTANGRTEIWHTSLQLASRGLLTPPALRAVWARDFEFGTGRPENMLLPCNGPFTFESLSPRDRGDIVISSALFNSNRPAARPLQLEQLMLTSLGGWLDVKGEWDTQTTGLSLESWVHRATGGRDQFVRVVRTGFLFPLGHRAVEVKITERKPGIPAGNPSRAAAYLRQRTFIVVRQPVRDYGDHDVADPDKGRGWPFASVRLLTSVTPNIGKQALDSVQTSKAFVPTVGGVPFRFEAVGVDHEGREIPFSMPIVWVNGSSSQAPGCDDGLPGPPNTKGDGIYTGANLAQVVQAYLALDETSAVRPNVALRGSPIAMTPTLPTGRGGTAYDTRAIRVTAGPSGNVPGQAQLDALFAKSEPPFYPLLEYAEVRLEAAAVVSGSGSPWARARYLPGYVTGGFGPGEVFAELLDHVDLAFTAQGRGGGVTTPNLELSGLSRTLGVFGGPPAVVNSGSGIDPVTMLLGNARLLGGLPLSSVVQNPTLATMPVVRTTTIGPATAPTSLDTTMTWRPVLKPDHPTDPVLGVSGESSLEIVGRYHRDLAIPANSTSLITGELHHISLTLAPKAQFVRVKFHRVSFRSQDGAKSEVKVDLEGVEFLGALRYLAKLADLIKAPDGGQNGPYLDVTPSLVTTGLAFALPAVQVGAFVLENIALRSELRLPLDGAPVTTRFAFSTRDDPFHLTVLALGGGGFAAVEIGADGPKALDVALEAGAMVALNVGVAKGKLEAFAGLYYRLESGSAAVYQAYLRMGGSLRVLGMVTVSSKIYIKLEYAPNADKFHGSASLSYSIDFGLFEKSVSFTVSRKFAGDSGDPFVTDRFAPAEWTDYCTAFALEAS